MSKLNDIIILIPKMGGYIVRGRPDPGFIDEPIAAFTNKGTLLKWLDKHLEDRPSNGGPLELSVEDRIRAELGPDD